MSWVAVAVGVGSLAAGVLSSGNAASAQTDAANTASRTQLQMFGQTQANLAPWMQGGQTALSGLESFMGLTPGTPGTPGTAATPGSWSGGTGAPNYNVGGAGGYSPGQGQGTFTPGSPGTAATAGTPGSVNPNAPGLQGFGLAQFQQSPAYQFNLQQGQQAIDKAANARGGYYNPSTLQDISKYSQGVASNEFQNAYNNYNQTQGNIFNRLQTMSGSGQNAATGLGGFASQTGQQVGANQIGAGSAQAAGIIGQNTAIQGGLSSLLQAYLAQQQAPQYGGVGTYNQSGLDAIGASGGSTGFVTG